MRAAALPPHGGFQEKRPGGGGESRGADPGPGAARGSPAGTFQAPPGSEAVTQGTRRLLGRSPGLPGPGRRAAGAGGELRLGPGLPASSLPVGVGERGWWLRRVPRVRGAGPAVSRLRHGVLVELEAKPATDSVALKVFSKRSDSVNPKAAGFLLGSWWVFTSRCFTSG